MILNFESNSLSGLVLHFQIGSGFFFVVENNREWKLIIVFKLSWDYCDGLWDLHL